MPSPLRSLLFVQRRRRRREKLHHLSRILIEIYLREAWRLSRARARRAQTIADLLRTNYLLGLWEPFAESLPGPRAASWVTFTCTNCAFAVPYVGFSSSSADQTAAAVMREFRAQTTTHQQQRQRQHINNGLLLPEPLPALMRSRANEIRKQNKALKKASASKTDASFKVATVQF